MSKILSAGHVFVFRGRRGDLIKFLWWDGDRLCLFAKPLERGRFAWPKTDSGTVALTRAQLAMLLEGIDWRQPARTWEAGDGRLKRNNIKQWICFGNTADWSSKAWHRKSYLFAGSDAGGERAAAIYSLLGTAKLNGIDPEAYLRSVLRRIADDPINRIRDLLPWKLFPAGPVAVEAA